MGFDQIGPADQYFDQVGKQRQAANHRVADVVSMQRAYDVINRKILENSDYDVVFFKKRTKLLFIVIIDLNEGKHLKVRPLFLCIIIMIKKQLKIQFLKLLN